jgi:hypothetical protein
LAKLADYLPSTLTIFAFPSLTSNAERLLVSALTLQAGEVGKGPLKVFILAGQSNMEGQGQIKSTANGGKGSLEFLVKDPASAARYKHLVDDKGQWVVRNDVWIWYLGRKGGLTVGYGARPDLIGPELQFGNIVGDGFDNRVLLIKTAWGGKSLARDFRPPSAGGEVGPSYTEMIKHVKDVLGDLKTQFPDYGGEGYEIGGAARTGFPANRRSANPAIRRVGGTADRRTGVGRWGELARTRLSSEPAWGRVGGWRERRGHGLRRRGQ